MRNKIRRWLGIEGQTWKYAVTSNNIASMSIKKARIPTPPSEPGNWELVTVAIRGWDVVFWWKAPVAPGAPPALETLSGKLDRFYDAAEKGQKEQ